ncbi:Bcl-2 1 [Brachionus plicatilis]|uniref:Bcl-2 1 n=1 Tax=Brachionus plicatilis TaxID=10195 RepID=A0A3M7S2P9_BRAPC|nr:Bcl-2 1 [Brachionus plicatilis]
MEKCISSLEVVKDYFTFRLNESSNLAKKDYFKSSSLEGQKDVLNTIRMLCYEAETKNRENYDYYIGYTMEKLENLAKNDYCMLIQKLQDIANLLFNDNIDWGRIISLLSFVSYFSYKYAWLNKDLGRASACACKLIEWLTSYLTCKCGMWIECNGGWESFGNYMENYRTYNVKKVPCC